jgi:hypothetical protein
MEKFELEKLPKEIKDKLSKIPAEQWPEFLKQREEALKKHAASAPESMEYGSGGSLVKSKEMSEEAEIEALKKRLQNK